MTFSDVRKFLLQVLMTQHYLIYAPMHSAGMPRLGSQGAAKLQTF